MNTLPPSEVLIIGCGDVGRRLAAVYRAEGREVAGLVRTAESAAALQAAGVRALRCELDGDDLPNLPSRRAALFYFAPPWTWAGTTCASNASWRTSSSPACRSASST